MRNLVELVISMRHAQKKYFAIKDRNSAPKQAWLVQATHLEGAVDKIIIDYFKATPWESEGWDDLTKKFYRSVTKMRQAQKHFFSALRHKPEPLYAVKAEWEPVAKEHEAIVDDLITQWDAKGERFVSNQLF